MTHYHRYPDLEPGSRPHLPYNCGVAGRARDSGINHRSPLIFQAIRTPKGTTGALGCRQFHHDHTAPTGGQGNFAPHQA